MTTRQMYELTKEEYDRLLNASKPVPYLVFGGVEPMSPQENANLVWQAIASERGFDWRSVQGAGGRTFTAVPIAEPPSETRTP